MKATLSTWKRVSLLAIVGRIEGTVLTIYRASKWMQALEFTPEETASIKLVENNGALSWSNAHDWEIELPDDAKALELVRSKFGEQQWPASAYKELIGLAEVLGVKMED
jgi:hypothetical protein